MASIVGWKRGNQTYYYLVESARVNGNRPDVTQFATVLDELTSRYGAILDTHSDGDPQDKDKDKAPLGPTVVFDAGQNSAANFAHLAETGLHFVGSLPPASFPDLLAVPARRRQTVDPHQYPGLSAYDTRALVFGADRRVVLTHSANLHTKQAAGFDQTLAKTTRDLGELAATLARGKTRRRLDAVQAEVHLLSKEQVRATESRRPASTVPRVTTPDEDGHRHSPSPPMPHQMQLGGLGRPSRYRATVPKD